MSDDTLLDDIYEAAIAADAWPRLLERMAHRFGCQGGLLFARSEAGLRWTSSAGIRHLYQEYIDLGWHMRTDRVEQGISLNHPGFFTDTDMRSEAELAHTPVYRDYLIPRGFAAGAATHVPGLHDSDLILSMEGFAGHGAARAQIPALDALRPHLARASMLAARLQLERARAAVAALAMVGSPACIIGEGRRLLACNELFEALLAGFGHDTPKGLHLHDARANAALGAALGRLGHDGQGVSLPVRLVPPARAVLHVLPMRGAARDLLTGASAILVLATLTKRRPPAAALIRDLLDLTPGEARLARALADAGNLADAAASLQLTQATARTHLKSIFAKTGVQRQSELLGLLASVAAP